MVNQDETLEKVSPKIKPIKLAKHGDRPDAGIRELLDCGYGRAVQPIQGTIEYASLSSWPSCVGAPGATDVRGRELRRARGR